MLNKIKLILLSTISILLFTQTSIAKDDKDNGGSVFEMQKAKALSREELTALLTFKSEDLKSILGALTSNVAAEDIEIENVRKIYEKMNSNAAKPLLNDVIYQNYSINEADFLKFCSKDNNNKHACTDFLPGSTIFLDLVGLLSANSSLADLVGLLMHEHSRHYAGDDDNKYELANYFKEAFLKEKHLGKKFDSFNGLKIKGIPYGWHTKKGNTYSQDLPHIKIAQQRFCELNGYKKSISADFYFTYDVQTKFWTLNEELNKVNQTENYAWIFRAITCVNLIRK